MNSPNPDKDLAKIVFVIFAFFMAIYLMLVHHVSYAKAQNNPGEKPFENLEQQDAIDKDPLTGLIDSGVIQKSIDYHFAFDNPYHKKGYDFNWRAHNDYEYFVWLEMDHRMSRKELEQREYEKIMIQRKITTAVMYNLVHCVRAVDELGVLNPYCTKDQFGCRERVFALVGYIVEAAYSLNLDPWLMTAVAMHESTFNPFALGPVGERGYFQINPNTPLGKKLKFIRSKAYRRHCRNILGNCQKEIAEAASVHLYKDFKHCQNNVRKALTKYNTGGCLFHGHVRRIYVRSVLKLKARLLNTKPAKPYCDPSRKNKTLDYYI